MSTTSSTRTRTQKGQLKRKNEALVSAHWTQITRYLAPPGVTWEWGECGLSHRLKYQLKERGLICRAPGESPGWMTTEALWFHVIERAAPEERVGEDAQGQQVLDAPPAAGESRLATNDNTVPDTIRGKPQSTLTGGVVDDRDTESSEEEMREPWRKDPMWSKPTPKELAASHPAQTGLTVWVTEGGSNTDEWDVDTTGLGGELPQPTGQVYHPASPGGQATLASFAACQWRVSVHG